MLCIQQAILNNRGIWEVPKLALRKHLVAELEQRTNDSCRSPKTFSPRNLITVRAAVAGSPRCLLAIGPLRHTAPTSPAATICIWPVSTNMFRLLSLNIYSRPRSGSWRPTSFWVTVVKDWVHLFAKILFALISHMSSCREKIPGWKRTVMLKLAWENAHHFFHVGPKPSDFTVF